eukprot:COSAG02_NODE_68014_length_251_cov_1.111842_1_plen_59_part_10
MLWDTIKEEALQRETQDACGLTRTNSTHRRCRSGHAMSKAAGRIRGVRYDHTEHIALTP